MDPWEGSTKNPQSLHKYLYAHADPVANVDYTGLFSFVETMAAKEIGVSLDIKKVVGVYLFKRMGIPGIINLSVAYNLAFFLPQLSWALETLADAMRPVTMRGAAYVDMAASNLLVGANYFTQAQATGTVVFINAYHKGLGAAYFAANLFRSYSAIISALEMMLEGFSWGDCRQYGYISANLDPLRILMTIKENRTQLSDDIILAAWFFRHYAAKQYLNAYEKYHEFGEALGRYSDAHGRFGARHGWGTAYVEAYTEFSSSYGVYFYSNHGLANIDVEFLWANTLISTTVSGSRCGFSPGGPSR